MLRSPSSLSLWGRPSLGTPPGAQFGVGRRLPTRAAPGSEVPGTRHLNVPAGASSTTGGPAIHQPESSRTGVFAILPSEPRVHTVTSVSFAT